MILLAPKVSFVNTCDGIKDAVLTLTASTTRRYFSEGNSVSFPEIFSKSEKGGGLDILCMVRFFVGCNGTTANYDHG